MSVVRYERPTDDAIKFIADNMRQGDAIEVMASGEHTPIEALTLSVKSSDSAVVVFIDDVPVAAFGLVRRDYLSGSGVPWLLSAEQALAHRRKFLELSPQVIDEMLQICPKLVNFVHSENKVSIRWLKWLGFVLEEAEPIGKNGAMFHRFSKEI